MIPMPAAPRRRPDAGDGLTRYFDRQHDRPAVKLLPGEYYVTTSEELLVTVLGSCVAACVIDPAARVAGMNHFMLPESDDSQHQATGLLGRAARYGDFAMESLINGILSRGGLRRRLVLKLFGGGQVLQGLGDVGASNIAFARAYVNAQGLRLVAEDLGGEHPRKIYFFPETGRVRVRILRSLRNDTIVVREADYRAKLAADPIQGAVELF
jgi:chemotaxis protein CheD